MHWLELESSLKHIEYALVRTSSSLKHIEYALFRTRIVLEAHIFRVIESSINSKGLE